MPAQPVPTEPKHAHQPAAAFTYTVRKLITIGHSFGITVPTPWARDIMRNASPYVTCQQNPDGTLTISPTPKPAARR